MKKILTLCLGFLMAVTTAKAQVEIGAIVGGMNGVSAKFWLDGELAVQTDLAVGLTAAYGGAYYQGNKFAEGQFDIYDFTLNPNLLYHIGLGGDFDMYFGGGFNIGMMSYLQNTNPNGIMGKFGANAALGVDWYAGPVVLALDFRPGYGLGFQDADAPHLSFFDWKLALAVRFAL